MKNQNISDSSQKEIITFHIKKCHQIILNMFSFAKVTPIMIQPKNIIQYAQSLQQMLQSFSEFLPKKFVTLNNYKKNEQQLHQKSQKVKQLLEKEKEMKIQAKILQDKIFQLEKYYSQTKAQKSLLQHFKMKDKLIIQMNQKQKAQQEQKLTSRFQKKRLSLPHLSSQKLIKAKSNKKKFSFIDHPGNGNQILIQHLMNKKL